LEISYRGVTRDWITERPFEERLFEGTYAMTMSRGDASDRSYDLLSMFGRGAIS
jgi:hypothetical protein